MECRRCGLFNPPAAVRCDCGFDFQTGAVQRVPGTGLGLPLASLGDRVAGQFIDTAIASGGLVLGMFITRSLGIGSTPAMILFFLYLFFADGMGDGQSFGKKLLKTHVVDEATGAPCSYGKSFIRNAVALLGVFDWGFIFGDKRQRLGDKAAGTIVVRKLGPGGR